MANLDDYMHFPGVYPARVLLTSRVIPGRLLLEALTSDKLEFLQTTVTPIIQQGRGSFLASPVICD